jgi:hypothetical protein
VSVLAPGERVRCRRRTGQWRALYQGGYLGQILSHTLGALASNSRRVLYWPGPGIGSSATVTLRCWGGLKALVLVSPSRLGAVLKAPPAAS